MLDPAALESAVRLQERTFLLLKWLGTAIDRGVVRFDTAHRYATEGESAADWIAEHFANLPVRCRPASRRFAWNPRGGRKRDFKLKAEEILAGERRVAERIASFEPAP
jgi:hypothetical protein